MRATLGAVFGAALLLASLPLAAQDDAADPIDTAFDDCLAAPAGESTQGMVECAVAAYQSWDAALNDAYDALMDALDPAQQAALRDAQRKWIAFRDADKAFGASTMTPDSGSMLRVSLNFAAVDTVRARVLALRAYLSDQTGQ
jgi:uncharacterized protein YecT (DUF1311 family)